MRWRRVGPPPDPLQRDACSSVVKREKNHQPSLLKDPNPAHLYKLNGAWPVAWESVARDDLRLDPGHNGKHDLHLADHGISSLHSCLLRNVESAKNFVQHV